MGCDHEPLGFRTKRRCRTRSKGNPMSKLDDDDLLLEILIRLPDPGTALRCKPVCKRWSSLISSPYFNRRFISHHQSKNAEGPPGEPSSLLSFIPLPNEEIRRRSIIFDCFKDLLLCGFTERGDYNGELARLYLVCNWFTKQWIALPLAPERTESPLGFVARLVCEPCRNSNHTLELGDGQVFVYSAEYRFRVVYAYQEMRAAVTKLDVFCSESGKWTKEALVLDGYGKNLRQNMISLNGKLWWSYLKQGETGIVAVNPFCPHITPIINNASGVLVASSKCNIAVSQGALYILVLEENEISPDGGASRNALNVWSLEKDGYIFLTSWCSISSRRSHTGLLQFQGTRNCKAYMMEATTVWFRAGKQQLSHKNANQLTKLSNLVIGEGATDQHHTIGVL
ncbi:unnamed protein product [Linum tenue]|uniref:F-box protein At3g26010-like beta-propeller domain-containing protein n=1 Tax=Linum tenue TaxID=586396 RepID=A0AAV0QP32_9ROSI|nr:unnamed protein product [Linum tenue]